MSKFIDKLKGLSKKEKIQICVLSAAVIVTIFGIMFMLSAGEMAVIFPAFLNIDNMLFRYIIVIGTMIIGIMTFSNVALTVENQKIRNRLTLGVTIFSTVLTIPLVYVFIALFPSVNGSYGPVGELMVRDIAERGFELIFKTNGALYGIYTAGLIMAIIFLAFPLLTGVLALKGKAIKISKSGIGTGDLPVIAKQKARAEQEAAAQASDDSAMADDSANEEA